MRLTQIQGLTENGRGYWQHVLPEGSTCGIVGGRLLVNAPGLDPYWVDEFGGLSQFKPYPSLHSDDGA